METPTSTLAPETRVDPNASFKALASLLRTEGWFQKKPTIRIMLELVLHVVLLMGGLTVFILADNLAVDLNIAGAFQIPGYREVGTDD